MPDGIDMAGRINVGRRFGKSWEFLRRKCDFYRGSTGSDSSNPHPGPADGATEGLFGVGARNADVFQ